MRFLFFLLTFLFITTAFCEDRYFVESAGDVVGLRLFADDFDKLNDTEKTALYYLYEAAKSGYDIAYDQTHRKALEIRDLLNELIYFADNSKHIDKVLLEKLKEYVYLFWINKCNYDTFSSYHKIKPDFTFDEFKNMVLKARENGYFKNIPQKQLNDKLETLKPFIFDMDFEPLIVDNSAVDPIKASPVNFYDETVTLEGYKQLERLTNRYILNSKVINDNGFIYEMPYRMGTNGFNVGLYNKEIKEIVSNLSKALPYVGKNLSDAIENLIAYYKTGEYKYWINFNIFWVNDVSNIDFTNGFIETYLDPLNQKGTWQSIILYENFNKNVNVDAIANNIQYFEDTKPWDKKYRKIWSTKPNTRSLSLLLAVGDAGPANRGGVKLPNEAEVSDNYNVKSYTYEMVNESRYLHTKHPSVLEFLPTSAKARAEKYGSLVDQVVRVALHESVGHGGGKVDLDVEPDSYLKEYYGSIEEARAELGSLWAVSDPKAIEFSIVPDHESQMAAFEQYATYGLRILQDVAGERIEEAHNRGIHAIIKYLSEYGAITKQKLDGKTYFLVTDFDKMRSGIGELLAKLMEIKGKGDYNAAKKFIEEYGLYYDKELKKEVDERIAKLNMPSMFIYIFPELRLIKTGDKAKIEIYMPESVIEQQLRFSKFID